MRKPKYCPELVGILDFRLRPLAVRGNRGLRPGGISDLKILNTRGFESRLLVIGISVAIRGMSTCKL